jgi:hypothetical protein
MEFNTSRRKLLQAGLVLPAAGFVAYRNFKENKMQPEIKEARQIRLHGRTMDIVIEQVEAFTIMGLTYRFTDPRGGGDAGKELLDDFAEEAKYYGISTDVTYAVTAEPSRVVNSRKYPPGRPSFYFTYGIAVGDEYIKSAPFVFCLRRIPAGKYGRVTVADAEIGLAYAAFDPRNWNGDGPKPNWALSFQRSPSQFAAAKGAPPKQDFYVSLGSSRDFILR